MSSACGGSSLDADAGSDDGEDIGSVAQAVYTDDTPPPLSGMLSAANEGCGRVLLKWPDVKWPDTPEPDESGLRYYRVYQNGALRSQTRAAPTREFANERSYLATGLEAGISYSFAVTALDYAGNESAELRTSITTHGAGTVFCRDGRLPSAPTLTKVAADSGTRACKRNVSLEMSATDLSPWWDPIPASGIAYYKVYRNSRFMGRSTDGEYEQYLGQYPGTTYWYRVKAVDNAGNESAWSNSVSYVIPADCEIGTPLPRTLRLLVLPVRPSDGPPDPFPASWVYDAVAGGETFPQYSMRDYFSEVSYGQVNVQVTRASRSWITLPEPTIKHNGTGYCTTETPQGWGYVCDHSKIIPQALAATGYAQSDFDYVLVVKNGMTDQFSNAQYSSIHVGVGSTTARGAHRVGLHELSHYLDGSVEHNGGSWYCPGRSAGSGFPSLGGLDIYDVHFGCNGIEGYGDKYSVLGHATNSYHLPMLDKWLKGYLNPAQTVVTPRGTSEHVLHSAESVSAGASVVRHLILPYDQCARSLGSDSAFFSIEYRTTTGFDADPLGYASSENPAVSGVQIRLAPHSGVYFGPVESVFMGTLELDGSTELNYQGRVITLLDANSDTAHVRIQRPMCWEVFPGKLGRRPEVAVDARSPAESEVDLEPTDKGAVFEDGGEVSEARESAFVDNCATGDCR